MDINQLKQLLKRHNLRPNFTYGQNFLIDDLILQDIADAAEITSADQILEIGPGIGNLTKILCERAGFVLSIEKDSKFFPILHSIKKDYKKNFRFEIADALEYDFQRALRERGITAAAEKNAEARNQRPFSSPLGDEPAAYKVVANIPYYITGKILQMLMTAKFKPKSIVVLTQKEVARNITAGPGKLSVLAISVQLYGKPEIVQIVPAKSFYPAPKVDSAILKIDLHREPKYKIIDEKKFFSVLKACFSGKRKQIHNTLANNLKIEKNKAQEILSQLKIKPSARPQELSIEDWVELNKLIS